MNNELDPKCLDRRQSQFAITNRGELIPCCYLDDERLRNNLDFVKLKMVSHIDDYDNIEDILETEEWQLFYSNLKQGKAFSICHNVCAKFDGPKKVLHNFHEQGEVIHTYSI